MLPVRQGARGSRFKLPPSLHINNMRDFQLHLSLAASRRAVASIVDFTLAGRAALEYLRDCCKGIRSQGSYTCRLSVTVVRTCPRLLLFSRITSLDCARGVETRFNGRNHDRSEIGSQGVTSECRSRVGYGTGFEPPGPLAAWSATPFLPLLPHASRPPCADSSTGKCSLPGIVSRAEMHAEI